MKERSLTMEDVHCKIAPGSLSLIQDFVNTVFGEFDHDEFSALLSTSIWLHAHGLLAENTLITEADRRRLIHLRTGLRDLLRANNNALPTNSQCVEMLNHLAYYAPLWIYFIDPQNVTLVPCSTGIDGVIASLLVIVHTAITHGTTWQRLKSCRNNSCQRAFYDSSKNHSGTWCDMRVCGNHMKSLTYRQRHKHSTLSSLDSLVKQG